MTKSWLSYITTQIRANPGVKLEDILNKYGNIYRQKKQKHEISSKKYKYKKKKNKTHKNKRKNKKSSNKRKKKKK